jgi:hypothetical protein
MAEATNLIALVRGYLEALEEPWVRDFVEGVDWNMQERRLVPTRLPCLRHLARAARISPMPERLLVLALAHDCLALRWGQTYSAAEFGEEFVANYGWTELFGARGHFVNDTVAGGFLVLGPYTLYPDHHHVAEELYVPLTGGTEWRMGEGPFVARRAGEAIHHPSNLMHAMRTNAEPLVALYLWRDGPLDQVSVVAPRPPAAGADAAADV